MHAPFSFELRTKIVFGPGSARLAGDELRKAGVTRALVVTDQGVAAAGLLQAVLDPLHQAGIDAVVFDGVETNPTIVTVENGYSTYVETGCDSLVAVGGGSSIDTAKAIGVLANNQGPLNQYEGADKVRDPIPPLIAVPTTAGTGSEVSFGAVVTDPVRRYKMSIRSQSQAPRVALLDPNMLTTLRPRLVAMTGMDTLTHAVEAYVSTAASPVTDLFALEAVRLTGEWLPQFTANPDNLAAAAGMQLACVYAAVAFANARLGTVHAMAHPLSAYYNLHHGLACAVLLPYVMEFNLFAAPQKYAEVARALGEVTEGLSSAEAARKATEAVRGLLTKLGLPQKLRDAGAAPDRIEDMAHDAIASGMHLTNPRETDLNTVVMLYEAAM